MVEYKKNVAIIGAGIFGLTVARELSKSNHFNITVFEAEKDIMMGASSNNLNRVHKGFHYPRSTKTAYQSKNNYQKFMRYFKNCTRKNIKSYYLISKNNTKTSLKNFIKFSKKISNNSKVINIKNLPFKTHNIKGAIKTNEGVYDWTKIKLFFIKKLKKKIKIILDTKLIKILIKKNLINLVDINSKIYGGYNYVIDCSYFFNNNFLRYKKKLKKKKISKNPNFRSFN
jgi:L-2-hydroxyglutarate oxidase LhgO